MFGLVKRLREENEELNERYRAELDKVSAWQVSTFRAQEGLKMAKQELESTIAYWEKEQDAWDDKYSALYEKYLNLLERYEKALKGVE